MSSSDNSTSGSLGTLPDVEAFKNTKQTVRDSKMGGKGNGSKQIIFEK